MSQLFSNIKVGNTSRSTFDLSHHQVTTSDFGYLLPICYRDMVPNDDFVVKPSVFCRLAPLAVPTYGRITCRIHHFFVPYRILYPHWDAFITGDSSNHTVPPYYLATGLQLALATDPAVSSGSGVVAERRGLYSRIMSNLGLNPYSVKNSPIGEKFAAFPFLAYYRIWLDWFMDSNIYDHPTMVAEFNEIIKDGGNLGNSSLTSYKFLEPRYSCYKKDYFTTAKVSPQAGSPSKVPVGFDPSGNPGFQSDSGNVSFGIGQSASYPYQVGQGGSSMISATDKLGSFAVEAFRLANSMQRYLERNNFVGSKIINRILAHFGVAPTPERLDMAEFIGGSSFPIQIGDITSTNAAVSDPSSGVYSDIVSNTKGLGLQAGKGVGAGSGDTVRYHAKEHGIFMSLMSILPDTGYYQGISRFWQKGVNGDPLDYFTPEFENLGYQEILNKELYVSSSQDSDGIFGYTPRFSEYKFQNDVLGGDFVSEYAKAADIDYDFPFGSFMDPWHLFRTLYYTSDNPLALNENFVELRNRNTNYDRIFQSSSPNFDHFYFNIDMDVKATRPMIGFGEPSLSANDEGDGNKINLPYGGTRL